MQISCQKTEPCLPRFVKTGLLLIQAAIATAAISAFLSTNSNQAHSEPASAPAIAVSIQEL